MTKTVKGPLALIAIAILLAVLALTNPSENDFKEWLTKQPISLESLGNAITGQFASRTNLIFLSIFSINQIDNKVSSAWIGFGRVFIKIK